MRCAAQKARSHCWGSSWVGYQQSCTLAEPHSTAHARTHTRQYGELVRMKASTTKMSLKQVSVASCKSASVSSKPMNVSRKPMNVSYKSMSVSF